MRQRGLAKVFGFSQFFEIQTKCFDISIVSIRIFCHVTSSEILEFFNRANWLYLIILAKKNLIMNSNEHSQPSPDVPQKKNNVFRYILIGVAVLLALKIISYKTHRGAEYGRISQNVLLFVDIIIPWPSQQQNFEQENTISMDQESGEDVSVSEKDVTEIEEAVEEELPEDLSKYNGEYLYKTEVFSDAAIFFKYYGTTWEVSESLDSIIYNVPDGHQVYVLKKEDDAAVKVYCDGYTGFMDKTLLRD